MVYIGLLTRRIFGFEIFCCTDRNNQPILFEANGTRLVTYGKRVSNIPACLARLHTLRPTGNITAEYRPRLPECSMPHDLRSDTAQHLLTVWEVVLSTKIRLPFRFTMIHGALRRHPPRRLSIPQPRHSVQS